MKWNITEEPINPSRNQTDRQNESEWMIDVSANKKTLIAKSKKKKQNKEKTGIQSHKKVLKIVYSFDQ